MGSLCSVSNNYIQDETHSTIRGPQEEDKKKNANLKSVYNKDTNVFNYIHKEGKRKYLTDFTPLEFCDEISRIFKIRIPFFDSSPLQAISNISYITGNGPYHEGLIFQSKKYNFYIAQSYPITFIKVKNFSQAISDIISFNNFNNSSRSYKIPEIYVPTLPITIIDIYEIINKLPNQYNLLTENCQNFVNNIVEVLKNKYQVKTINNQLKIDESLNDITNVNIKRDKRKNKRSDSLDKETIPKYVDEDKIYLINIYENRNKLKNSRSEGSLTGRFTNRLSHNVRRKKYISPIRDKK